MKNSKTKFYKVSLCQPMGLLLSLCLIILFPTLAASEGIVKIGWDANTESDLEGYNVYVGTSAGNYVLPQEVGNVTEYYVTNLEKGTTYYFALTAFDLAGGESEPSNEISTTITFDSFFLTMDVQGNGEITSDPPGIICPEGKCKIPYQSGTPLTLLATPLKNGWQFVGWGGDCSGTESCTIQLMSDQIVTATFEKGGGGGGKGKPK